MQTDATSHNIVACCWGFLANNVASVCMGLKVWPVSNYAQQAPTLLWFHAKGHNCLIQGITCCWPTILRPFAWTLKCFRWKVHKLRKSNDKWKNFICDRYFRLLYMASQATENSVTKKYQIEENATGYKHMLTLNFKLLIYIHDCKLWLLSHSLSRAVSHYCFRRGFRGGAGRAAAPLLLEYL